MTVHSSTQLRTLADAVSIAGHGGDIAVGDVGFTIQAVNHEGATLTLADNSSQSWAGFTANDRLEWTVVASTRDDVTLTDGALPIPDGSRVTFVPPTYSGSDRVETGVVLSSHPVLTIGAPAPTSEPDTTVPAPTESQIIPRTSGDAHSLLTTLRTFGDPTEDLLSALRTLRTFLPGGKAETAGSEHQRASDLCGEYENIVTPVLGWSPRPSLVDSGYDKRAQFIAELERMERAGREANQTPSLIVQRFAERYAPDGPVNDALRDHIVGHLESHKVPAANELLEALGMTPADEEEQEREFVVYVDVTRTFTATQQVAVRVTARNEDEASEAVDGDRVAEYTSDYAEDWSIDVDSTRYGSDIDDWVVNYVEED